MKKPKHLRTTFASYALSDCIGEGGSGVVYRATEESGRAVAIKILDPAKANREKLKRFENEYRFCSRNKHQNIITVLDHGLSEEQAPFFVMPLYKGSTRQLIGKLTPRDALTVFEKRRIKGARVDIFLNIVPGPFNLPPGVLGPKEI